MTSTPALDNIPQDLRRTPSTQGEKDFSTNLQLSKKTVDLLRNFSTINKSIIIEEGKFLQTMSVNRYHCHVRLQ